MVSGILLAIEAAFGLQQGIFYSIIGAALGFTGQPIDIALSGFLLHLLTAILVGIAGGLSVVLCPFLKLSSMKKSLAVGLAVSMSAWVALFLPVTLAIVNPALDRIMVPAEDGSGLYVSASQLAGMFSMIVAGSLAFHALYGLAYGSIMGVLIPGKSRLYLCDWCDGAFSTEQKLRSHLSEHHAGYICTNCKMEFIDKQMYLAHTKECV